jgi:gas vesicle protein
MTDYERYSDYQPADHGHVGLALTFLFIGLGAGALVGLLFAPKSGKQMRRNLKRRYEDARDVIEDWSEQAGDVIGKGAEYANFVKDRVAPIGKVVIKATK